MESSLDLCPSTLQLQLKMDFFFFPIHLGIQFKYPNMGQKTPLGQVKHFLLQSSWFLEIQEMALIMAELFLVYSKIFTSEFN